MLETIRMIVLVAAIWGGYFLIGKHTALSGVKKHATALFLGLLVAGMFIGATQADQERKDKELKVRTANESAAKEHADKAAAAAADEEKKKALVALENLNADIHIACERAVKNKLVSPKSADFSWLKERFGTNKNGQWVLQNEVGVKNAFGTEVRHSFICTAESIGGQVVVKSLVFAK